MEIATRGLAGFEYGRKNVRCRQKFKRSSQGAGTTICNIYEVRIGGPEIDAIKFENAIPDIKRERNEPPHGKTNNVVFEHVQHRPVCTVTEER